MFSFLTSGARDISDPLASVKSVSVWLRGLPAQDVVGRQQAVMDAFEAMRQNGRITDPARVQALQYLDAALGADRRQLVKQFVEHVDAPKLADRIWKSAFDLTQAFATTYQAALEESILQAGNPRWKGMTPLLFARLLHYFGTDAKLRVFKFERWIPAKWVELHRCYMRATELGIDRVPTTLGQSGHNTTAWTVEQEYIFVLLIQQLNTGNLSPAEVDWGCAQLRSWCRRLKLEAMTGSLEGFFVDVGAKTGISRRTGHDKGMMIRFLDTTPLVDQLDRAVLALRQSESPERREQGTVNSRRIVILEKMRPAFAPTLIGELRKEVRVPCTVTAKVRIGLSRISHEFNTRQLVAAGGQAPASEMDSNTEHIEVFAVADGPRPRRQPVADNDTIAASLMAFHDPMWQVKDRSVAGLRIGATGGVGQTMALGALVAIRQSDAANWLLGVVRRLNKVSNDEVDGGVSIIAEDIVPVTLYALHNPDEQAAQQVHGGGELSSTGARFEALYLPPPSRPDKPLMVKTMIVPTSEYSEGRKVLLTTGRSIYTVAMRHLIEQRADWSWTAVQIIDKRGKP